MKAKERALKIMSKGNKEIKRELIGYIRRVKYLEGKEFYDGIVKDIRRQDDNPRGAE